jgi:5-methylcytosine-specific restriction endonuclease McrA
MAKRLTRIQRYRRNRRRKVFERDGYRCVSCGRKAPPGGLTLDHIVPKSKGGRGTVENLQTMCVPCNQEKADALPARLEIHPWRPERINGGRRKVAA